MNRGIPRRLLFAAIAVAVVAGVTAAAVLCFWALSEFATDALDYSAIVKNDTPEAIWEVRLAYGEHEVSVPIIGPGDAVDELLIMHPMPLHAELSWQSAGSNTHTCTVALFSDENARRIIFHVETNRVDAFLKSWDLDGSTTMRRLDDR